MTRSARAPRAEADAGARSGRGVVRILVLVLAALAQGLGWQAARAEGPAPDAAQILRSDAYVAEYDTSMGGKVILRRGQEREAEIEAGQLLFGSDVVEIASGRPRVAIKSPGRERLFYLPEDGKVFRVSPRRTDGADGSVLPTWVRNLFARRHLTQTRGTMARDLAGADPSSASAGCDGAARGAGQVPVRPVVQILAPERSRVTVIWQDMPVGRVEVVLKDGSVLASKDVAGRSAALSIDRTRRAEVERVRLRQDDGRLAMEIPVRFAGPSPGDPRPASDEARLVSALNDLKPRCARRDERTLENMSLIADQKDRSLAAAVVFDAIASGDLRW